MLFRKTVVFLMLGVGVLFAHSASAQKAPLTRDQVQLMVRGGLGDESGAKVIEQRGIDFVPADDFLQSLKAAGASEAFLKALGAAKPSSPAGAKKPLRQVQILALLAGGVPSSRVTMLAEERGIDFEPTGDYLQQVRAAGGEDELIRELKNAQVAKPATVDAATEAQQTEVRQLVARGAEFQQKGQYALAEQDYRAALRLDSHDADIYLSLAYVLIGQKKWDEAASAGREALRLDPNNDVGHLNLGITLGHQGDWDGAIAEYREALRLSPDYAKAHYALGDALGHKQDWDGEIAECREAARLNPHDDLPHYDIGNALGAKGDTEGQLTEYREAIRLNPRNDKAHVKVGMLLAVKKGDWEGSRAEEREALRINPDNDLGHFALGLGLEQQEDLPGALEEYHAACTLDPENKSYRENYERLLHQLKK